MWLLWLILGVAIGLVTAYLRLSLTRRALRQVAGALEQLAAGRGRPDVRDVWRDGSRRPIRVVRQIARDVHNYERRTSETIRRLERQRSDLNALVDALPDPIVQADKQRRLILVNQPAVELLGVPKEQAIGATVEAAITEPEVLALFDKVAKIAIGDLGRNGKPRLPVRRELRLSSGGRQMAYQAVATRSEAGGVIVVLRDISTLDQALRMKADFVANASHELRTPVAAIKVAYETLIELLDEASKPTPAAQRCLSILGGHLQRVEEMLQDLLDLSKVEDADQTPSLEMTSLAELSRDLRQTVGPLAARRDVMLELPDGSADAFVTDRKLLLLALKNLLENGVKHTPANGKVTLRIQRLTGGDGDEIRLIVEDTGVGIPDDHIDRIFERFYQVDAARTGTNARSVDRGTGLGLSIVKHAINALAGSVLVESAVGSGTRFIVTLPEVEAPAS